MPDLSAQKNSCICWGVAVFRKCGAVCVQFDDIGRVETLAVHRDFPWGLVDKMRTNGEGLPAIEEAIFAGVPVNVTLLFSCPQYVAAAEAYMRGIERRIAAGLNPQVGSVASLFVSRWDVAVVGKEPEWLRNQLGIAVAWQTHERYRHLLDSPRSEILGLSVARRASPGSGWRQRQPQRDDSGGDVGAIGWPTTAIEADELSVPAMLNGIRAGRTFIDLTASRDKMLDFEADAQGASARMGGTLHIPGHIPGGTVISLRIHTVATEGSVVHLLLDGEDTNTPLPLEASTRP